MHVVLILRELSESEIHQVNSLADRTEINIVGEPEFVKNFPTAKFISKLSEDEKKSINYRILNEILDFGDATIQDQTISKHLTILGAGLWYYHKFRIYFKIRNRQYEIDEIEKNLLNASSATIYTSGGDHLEREKSFDKFKFVRQPGKKKSRLSFTSILQYTFVVLIRFFKSVFSPVSDLHKKEILCIDAVSQYRNILSMDGTSKIFENAYLGYFFQKKSDRLGFIDQLLIPKFKGEDRYQFHKEHIINHNRRTRIYGEQIMVSGLISLKTLRSFLKAKKDLYRTCKILMEELKTDTTRQKYLYEFNRLKFTSLFYLFKFLAYTNYFTGKKYTSIITTDENSANYKIILEAARCNGIRTVGYQHGSIHDLHPAYRYTISDKVNKPVPDLTITWGKKWADFLLNKANYPKSAIGVAGQIRTDIIQNLINRPDIRASEIIKGADRKQIILFATQPQRDPELRFRAAEDVVKACKQVRSSHLVFKLHPRENDPGYYEEIAQKYQLKNFTICTNEELYILLHVAELVITCFSTVGSEALYFKKPLIILDHLKQDILNYHKDGVAFQASNSEELAMLLQQVLAGEIAIPPSVLENYLEKSIYKIDGLVSERVWDLISAKMHSRN